MRIPFTFAGILVPLLLTACGGSGGGSPEKVQLAVDSLPATAPVAADPADTLGELLLTRLSVTLAADATARQLDAAMAAVGATGFAYASPGSPTLTLAVPRQADGTALVALAQKLRAMPGIASAAPGRQMTSLILPGVSTGNPQPPSMLQHLLPSRFPAAWNAAFDEDGEPAHGGVCTAIDTTIIVVDAFQSLPANPAGQFDLYDYAELFGVHEEGSEEHGWLVATTLSGPFDEREPTGATALAECVHHVLVDISYQTYEQIVALLKQAILAQPSNARLIVNLSIGYGKKFCGPGLNEMCTAENAAATPPGLLQWEIERRVLAAVEWAAFSSAALEERMLLVQAAGNEKVELAVNGGLGVRYTGMRQAHLVSSFVLATQLGALEALYSPQSQQAVALWTSEGQPSLLLDTANVEFLRQTAASRASRIPGMGNLLLVGSATLPDSYWHGDVAESAFSNEGAMLLAVGEQVITHGGHLKDGTSFAAPQVAGLAAYLWTISDLDLRPASDTAALIKATATSRSLLDAYAATLALDTLPAIGTPGIREAVLDVDGDDRFDERDLQRFVDAYGLGNPDPPEPEPFDYGRFDLNGDGTIGGINAMAFDLDRGATTPGAGPQFGAVDREVEGYPVTFNEPVLSDLQVLCYYAYSSQYAGGSPTPAQAEFRTAVLGPDHCVGVRMNTLFPSQVTDSAPLEVTLEVPAGNGQHAPAPNLYVAFTPSCGSVSPASGRTDAAGRTSTMVEATGCSGSVSVTAVASANAGTTPLARGTATATVGGIVFGDDITLCRQALIQAFNASGISRVAGNLSIRFEEDCWEEDLGPVTETALNISLPALVEVGGDLYIDGPVTAISAAGLKTVGGDFGVSGTTGSASPSFPVLESVAGGLYFNDNAGLTSANFPQLEYVGDSLFVDHNTVMTSVRLRLLAQVFTGYLNHGGIFIDHNPVMTQLEIGPAFITTSSGGLFIDNNATLPSLMDVSCEIRGGGVWITANPALPEAEVERFLDCVRP